MKGKHLATPFVVVAAFRYNRFSSRTCFGYFSRIFLELEQMADAADKAVEENGSKTAAKSDATEEAPAAAKETKTETTECSDEKLEQSIIRQVEYYFGDANLNRDKFLLEQISKDEEGWVPLSVLLTFKRLAALTTDAAVIADALMKSDEGLVEVSDDKLKVRRHPERPIPEHNEERRKEIMSRTAYVKGFPLDIQMGTLIDYFAAFDKVVNINMRKYLDKPTKSYKFKGSVFVTFEKKEQTENFIEKGNATYNNNKLICKWQEKYLEEKREEYKAKSKKKSKKAEEEKLELPKGTVVFFEGATEDVTRELLREAVEKVEGDWEIAYIEFSKGDKDGHIRFQEEGSAAKFIEKLEDKKLKVKEEINLVLRTLSEEEEQAFLAKAAEHMKSRRNHHNKHKGGHGNRKRRGGNENRNDEKKKKEDE